MQKGLTEEKIAPLGGYENSPAFTPREKSALRFSEKLAMDYDSIDTDEFLISGSSNILPTPRSSSLAS